MQVDPIKPELKAPGINLLTLKLDEPLATCAFTFNSRRCNEGLDVAGAVTFLDKILGGGARQTLLATSSILNRRFSTS